MQEQVRAVLAPVNEKPNVTAHKDILDNCMVVIWGATCGRHTLSHIGKTLYSKSLSSTYRSSDI